MKKEKENNKKYIKNIEKEHNKKIEEQKDKLQKAAKEFEQQKQILEKNGWDMKD